MKKTAVLASAFTVAHLLGLPGAHAAWRAEFLPLGNYIGAEANSYGHGRIKGAVIGQDEYRRVYRRAAYWDVGSTGISAPVVLPSGENGVINADSVLIDQHENPAVLFGNARVNDKPVARHWMIGSTGVTWYDMTTAKVGSSTAPLVRSDWGVVFDAQAQITVGTSCPQPGQAGVSQTDYNTCNSGLGLSSGWATYWSANSGASGFTGRVVHPRGYTNSAMLATDADKAFGVGYARDSNGVERPIVWPRYGSNGPYVELDLPAGATSARATAVEDFRVAVQVDGKAWIWPDFLSIGAYGLVSLHPPGFDVSGVQSMRSGWQAGYAMTYGPHDPHAFAWRNSMGSATDLHASLPRPDCTQSRANDVEGGGHVVGWARCGGGQLQAVLWRWMGTAVSGLTLDKTRVSEPTTVTATIHLDGPAPAEGAVVTLSSDSPFATLNLRSLTIPSDGESATFTIQTYAPPTWRETATISASFGGQTKQVLLSITNGSLQLAPSPYQNIGKPTVYVPKGTIPLP